MSIDIKVPLRDSLGLVGVQPDKVSFTDPYSLKLLCIFSKLVLYRRIKRHCNQERCRYRKLC